MRYLARIVLDSEEVHGHAWFHIERVFLNKEKEKDSYLISSTHCMIHIVQSQQAHNRRGRRAVADNYRDHLLYLDSDLLTEMKPGRKPGN